MESNKRIAIVGAGLTGLTTSFYLKKAGFKVVVFEKNDRAGGVIKTLLENGFTYECGPNTGVLSHPEALELIEELFPLCKLENANEAAKSRWIWKGKKWHALPSGLMSAVTTPLFSLYDKFRILGEPFRKKGTNPNETLEGLVKRRMGKSFLNYAVDPFILGIYAGDPAYLVPKYALPKLYNLEQKYGSFVGGTIKKAKEPKSERDKKATREIFSVEGGLQNLVNALVSRVGPENIKLNSVGLTIGKSENQQYTIALPDGTSDRFDTVIVTAGAFTFNQLLPFVDHEILAKITQLKYAKVAQISLGFNKWEGVKLNAFGGLVPFREKRDILGVLFISSFLKNRAPENGALLSVFIGGLRRPELAELSDDQIVELVKSEFKLMMKLPDFNPDLFKIHRYDHAIPQYGHDSEAKLAAIELLESRYPGLLIAGNTLEGIGMADRIKQGRVVAEKLTAN